MNRTSFLSSISKPTKVFQYQLPTRATTMKLIFETLFAICWCLRMTTATCYNPDGSEAQNSAAFQPCNQVTGTISQCCGTNWTGVNPEIANDVCQPNGLCLNSAHGLPLFWRSSCTDKTWQSPFCLKGLCTSVDVSQSLDI